MEDAIYGVQQHHRHQHHGHDQPSASVMHDDDLHALIASIPARRPPPSSSYGAGSTATVDGNGAGVCNTAIKAKIASHPRYSRLLDAYIDCQKVGAPPEIASLLEEIRRQNCDPSSRNAASSLVLGADPELDLFMDTYCEVLAKYKADLARPFDEATSFFNSMELQLTDICKSTAAMASAADEAEGSTEEEQSGGEMDIHESHPREEDKDIKEKLLRKYSGYLSNLKQEFSKKKKKGKLPKEARQTLLDWWNVHYKWPYPTESDKISLAELTGLDQKQINNWFINQRKRHWKPSESMQYAVMDSLSSAPYFG